VELANRDSLEHTDAALKALGIGALHRGQDPEDVVVDIA
jgi:hypothetical protein